MKKVSALILAFALVVAAFSSFAETMGPGETAESKAFHAKQVVHTPYEGELERSVAYVILNKVCDVLVHQLECECVAEVVVVQEIFHTKQPGIRCSNAAVPFNVQAQGTKLAALPEINSAGNLGVITYRCVLVGMIDVVEEESASPFVGLEHLKGCRQVTAVKVVHLLDVGLGFQAQCCH